MAANVARDEASREREDWERERGIPAEEHGNVERERDYQERRTGAIASAGDSPGVYIPSLSPGEPGETASRFGQQNPEAEPG